MSEKWSEKLVKRKISDFLVEELIEQTAEPIPTEILDLLKHEIVEKADLKKLRDAIRLLKKYADEDMVDYIREEYEEIKDDIDWAATAKGKCILDINDWVQGFYEEFRTKDEFANVAIGGHTTKEVVFVAGTVSTTENLDALKTYVSSKSPPLDVLYEVRVAA